MKSKILGLLAVALLAASIAADANLIDFESATTTVCQVTDGGSIDGFTLSSFGGDSSGGINSATACSFIVPTANSGSNYMLNFNSLIGEFTKDVGTFDLLSLFVHADTRVGDTITTVRFQGLDGEGSLLYQLDSLISASWQQVSFSGWNDLKTFTWDSLSPNTSNIAIDDFQFAVASVPEPTTLALLGLGLGLVGMGYARRRESA